MSQDHDEYQNYLYEIDAPRQYLEETYPVFYNYFKERFEKFINDWEKSTNINGLNKRFLDELFVDLCNNINNAIRADKYLYKIILNVIEKNGLTKKENAKINLHQDSIDKLINTVLELPELVIYSFKNDLEKIKKKLDEWENKYSKYPKELFIEAFRIQKLNVGKRPKITDEDAIILANENLQLFLPEKLIDSFGQKTHELLLIKNSYSNYHRPLLKKGRGEY